MRLAVGEAGQERVELGGGEGPFKRLGDLAVVRLEAVIRAASASRSAKSLGVSALRCRIEK